MDLSALTNSAQNYLKAIWSLQEWSPAPVTPTAIAERAGVRVSTVSGAMVKLAEQGLISHEKYGAISLTGQGRGLAVAMVRRHRLIETFLVSILGYRWDQVHDEAEQLEHAVSDFMIERIDALLDFPDRDPHGDPIPRRDGTVSRPDAVVLNSVTPGRQVVVERISDADPDLLKFFAERGIVVGAELVVQPGTPYSDSVEVRLASGKGGAASLGRSALEAVWVILPETGS